MKKYKDSMWVVDQLYQGKRNKDIAALCGVSVHTISNHISNYLNALDVPQLVHLINNSKDPKRLISPKTKAYEKIVQATSLLPKTTQLRERCWYLTNNTQTPPKCKICDSHVLWDYSEQRFRTYCSHICQGKDPEVKNKRIQTNINNNGVSFPASSPIIYEKRRNTLFEKYGVTHQNQRHIDPASLNTLGNEKTLQDLFQQKSTFEIANDLGVSQSVVSKYLRKHNINCTKRTGSRHERKIIMFIKNLTNEDIIIQSRKIIPPHELDIYIPALNLAIEFNGLFWHSELSGKDKNYHINKTLLCEERGIRLIHINEYLWLNKQDLIESRLKNLLRKNVNRIYARDCSIVDNLTTSFIKQFLKENHIQGFAPSKHYIGLEFNGSIVSVMTFGKSRYNAKYDYELVRFCSIQNTNVVGGASKLFSYFVKQYIPKSIITYSDKTWNTGNVYKHMGFTYSHTAIPNYYYFKDGTFTVHSRVKFQKHKLQKQFENFDPMLSEWENMKQNGYNRIWDCGNDVFIWKSNY